MMKCVVLRGINLNTEVYRGYASVASIAQVSDADTFKQQDNPDGLQRGLEEAHARKAYRYARGDGYPPGQNRAWAEVLLNVRDPSVVRLTAIDAARGFFELEICDELIHKKDLPRPQISRTDGNHRLHFAGGDSHANQPPLDEISVPFAMTIGLAPDAEAFLFMDVNDNQRAMNTSHLDHLKYRLTGEAPLMDTQPELVIAERLIDDPHSPWCGLVFKGGERSQGFKRGLNLAALRTGIQMSLQQSVKMRPLDFAAKYAFLRIFWNAVKATYTSEWSTKKSHLMTGMGIMVFSQVGSDVIDRCIVRSVLAGSLQNEMCAYLRQTQGIYDWHTNTGFVGYGGRSGASKIANDLKRRLSDDDLDWRQLAEAVKNLT
jgi:DGQHR domain-containing protein